MRLSRRLQAVARLAAGTVRMADVGTDHGYIPIYLVQKAHAEHAIAMDIKRGPLERAKENIRLYGLEDKIETRLSDGVAELRAGEVDTVVIAGMGGALTINILREGKEILSSVEALVLQPQSELHLVRRYLQNNGYCIAAEDMELDEGKYYPMMKVRHGIQKEWEEYESRYGRYLIQQQNPILGEYLEKELKTCENIRRELQEKQGGHIERRLEEVEHQIQLIKRAKEDMK